MRTTLPSWQRDRGRLLAARWQGTAQGSEVRRWPGGGLRVCVLGSGSHLLGWTSGSARASLSLSQSSLPHTVRLTQ